MPLQLFSKILSLIKFILLINVTFTVAIAQDVTCVKFILFISVLANEKIKQLACSRSEIYFRLFFCLETIYFKTLD